MFGQAKKFNQAMNILNVMKQQNLKPGVIIYTNLLQICFNMRKVDRAVILYEKMQQENVQSKKLFKKFNELKLIFSGSCLFHQTCEWSDELREN